MTEQVCRYISDRRGLSVFAYRLPLVLLFPIHNTELVKDFPCPLHAIFCQPQAFVAMLIDYQSFTVQFSMDVTALNFHTNPLDTLQRQSAYGTAQLPPPYPLDTSRRTNDQRRTAHQR